jgi:hypothetical protein
VPSPSRTGSSFKTSGSIKLPATQYNNPEDHNPQCQCCYTCRVIITLNAKQIFSLGYGNTPTKCCTGCTSYTPALYFDSPEFKYWPRDSLPQVSPLLSSGPPGKLPGHYQNYTITPSFHSFSFHTTWGPLLTVFSVLSHK